MAQVSTDELAVPLRPPRPLCCGFIDLPMKSIQ